MFLPPQPPPVPPSLDIKGPIPVINKDLLFNIEKGIKLKKIPESMKNDRSEVSFSRNCIKNGNHNNAPTSGMQPFDQYRKPKLQKSFTVFQPERTNNISSINNGQNSNNLSNSETIKNLSFNVQSRPSGRFSIDNGIHDNNNNSEPNQMLGRNIELRTKSVATDQLSMMLQVNMNKFSLTASNITSLNRPLPKSNIPSQKQFVEIFNNPVSPPLPERKPSISATNNLDSAKSISTTFGNEGSFLNQSCHVRSIMQPPPVTSQVTSGDFVNDIQLKSSVTRLTTNPPPPLPNALRKDLRYIQNSSIPPPLPSRISCQPISRVPSQSNNSRPASYAGCQYNVRDRPLPPPPLLPNTLPHQSVKIFQSLFDNRFNFPSESLFPSLRQRKISNVSFSKSLSIN